MRSPVVTRQDQRGVLVPRRRAGTTTWRPGSTLDRELLPATGDRRAPSPSPPTVDTDWAGVLEQPQRHRRLHLDGVGLPRRGGHRPHRVRRTSRTRSACRRSAATTRGSPPGAPTSTSPVTAGRSRTTGRSSSASAPTRTSPCSGPSTTARRSCTRARGRGATSSSSWSWAGHEGAPVVVEVYADADEVELLVNGRSLGRQPAGAEHRFRAEFETTYEPGELEAVAWRDGEEIGRADAALGDAVRCCSTPGSTASEIDADRPRPGLRRAHAGRRRGIGAHRRRPTRHRRGRRPRRAPGPRQRATRAPRSRSPAPTCTTVRRSRPRGRPPDRRRDDHA